MNIPAEKYKVVCFGESLWDVLPGSVYPGGAPMNVAYHVNKLGILPALITRVGHDPEGKRLILLMEKYGIPTDFFQMDFEWDTGKVIATAAENGEVSYDILKSVAWDHIQWDDQFASLVSESAYFVYGSLSARHETSRNTLFRLLELAKNKVVDINLRPPHYSRPLIERLISNVVLLKLNLAELELVTGWFSKYTHEADRIKILQDKFHIPTILVTRGGNGALCNINGVLYEHPGFAVKLADTIGSGDAFLAGFISKLSREAEPAEALEFASALGALVASYHGPCPNYDVKEINQLIKTNIKTKTKS